MVIAVMILGIHNVNPSALFAKLFAAVPKTTATVGVFKFNQIPNLYTLLGLGLIIVGVLMVNLMGKTNI